MIFLLGRYQSRGSFVPRLCLSSLVRAFPLGDALPKMDILQPPVWWGIQLSKLHQCLGHANSTKISQTVSHFSISLTICSLTASEWELMHSA